MSTQASRQLLYPQSLLFISGLKNYLHAESASS